jgi:hypothetical protein
MLSKVWGGRASRVSLEQCCNLAKDATRSVLGPNQIHVLIVGHFLHMHQVGKPAAVPKIARTHPSSHQTRASLRPPRHAKAADGGEAAYWLRRWRTSPAQSAR